MVQISRLNLKFQIQISDLKFQISMLRTTANQQFALRSSALRFRKQTRVIIAMGRFDLRQLHILFHVLDAAHAD